MQNEKNIFQRIAGSLTDMSARMGLATVKLAAALALGIAGFFRLIGTELLDFGKGLLKIVKWLFGEFTQTLRERHRRNKELQKAVRKAKEQDPHTYREALARFIGSYLFGEGGIFYTLFNYIMPIVSFAFLIGVIRYGSGLEYGISVEFNGREIGIISEESEFDRAEREALQRISYSDENNVDMSAKLSLKIISDNDRLLSSEQLANKMLEASDEALSEAYGIYIDGQFIGAVNDKEPVQNALNERLLNYKVEGNVSNITYKNKIEYSKGIYLADSIVDQNETIKKLTSSVTKKGVYVAQSGDTASDICRKYNMNMEDFRLLNPMLGNNIRAGQLININETESYLPVQYVIDVDTISILDYETVEIETSSLNVGSRQILVNGEKGEKHTKYEITYVDGIERSRKIVGTKVTREPVVEEIGVGTYSAHPDSRSTLLTGSGQFGWPVNGGYISDPFISNRNHKGMDIAAPGGTEIYAAADGQVIAAGWNSFGYGNVVQIAHDESYQTVYGHMSKVLVTDGQYVRRGQLIGLVGTTGNSTGNHCHFEVRYMGVCKNPALYLNTTEYAYGTESDDDDDDDE